MTKSLTKPVNIKKQKENAMRRGDYLRRIRMIFFALIMAAILVLGTGCGAESGAPDGEEPEVQEEAEQSEKSAGEESVYSAYRDVLLENEEDIRDYYWQEDSDGELVDNYTFDEDGNMVRPEENNNECIAFTDINNDGTDELLFMSAENEVIANLHIYTYDPDMQDAVEMDYERKTETGDDRVCLSDVAVAGGSRYMVFKGKEPGTLYMAYIITDETAFSDMTEFTCTPDGKMTRNWIASNAYSYFDKSDVYHLDGEEVSGEEGSKYFTQANKNYGELIMFSGYTDIMSVFEHVKSDSPAAMCFDDAMDWLDDRIDQ